MTVKLSRSCIALGMVIFLYGPVVWAQSEAASIGPDWQQIALWFGGLILFFVGLYAQWQRSAISDLKSRVGEGEKNFIALQRMLDREYRTYQEVQSTLAGLGTAVDKLRDILDSLQRRLDFAGIPYQPK